MEVGDQNEELGHSLSCSDPHLLPKLNDCKTNSGAGANAGLLNVDMKFAATDPLSELVWCPRNGLSLRGSDYSFTNNRKLFSPHIAVGSGHEVNPRKARSHETGFHVNLQVRAADCLPSDEMDKPSSGTGGFKVDNDDRFSIQQAEETEAGEGNLRRSIDDPRAIWETTGSLSINQMSRMENLMNLDLGIEKGAEAHERSTVLGEKEDGDWVKQANRLNVSCLEHLESTAENDLPTPAAPVCETSAWEGCRQGCLQGGTEIEKADPPKCSPMEERKGKETVMSDGSVDGRTKKDDGDDESFGSVESCNTAALDSRGKKRLNFEQQQLIAGTKQVKTQIQECPVSTSRLKQDSSFMNWISNMTKGFWKANEEDKSPSAALNGAHTNDHVDRAPDQDSSVCCQNLDNRHRNTGFRSIFHSIYCPKRKFQEVDAELPNEACDTNATPVSCLGKFPKFQEKFLITNENRMSTSDNEVGLEIEPIPSSGKLASSQANKAVSFENQRLCNNEDYMDKKVKCSSLLGKSLQEKDQKVHAEADVKAAQSFASKDDGLGSLWITRFSSRSFCLQNKDYGDRRNSEAIECSNECRNRNSSDELKETNESTSIVLKTYDLQKITMENNVPECFGTINCYDESIMIRNLNSIASSPRTKSLEALACLFARRVDAIKHIMPSVLAENDEGSTIFICFYCGKKGHRLWDCSEVTDTELRGLMRNITAWDGMNEASSLCIRCFRLNHWAAECPNAPLHKSGTKKIKITKPERATIDDAKKFTEENQIKKHVEASTSGVKLQSFCDSVNKQVLYAPEGIFDAVRVLRLSRTDILKWMTSKISLSHLEGFFLRLRLGKWEEGLGGTGYYVACITGVSEEESSISVTVGGMTCTVESRYISNQDFLEEELKAWWRATARCGGGLPSEEELCRKMQQRKMLGF